MQARDVAELRARIEAELAATRLVVGGSGSSGRLVGGVGAIGDVDRCGDDHHIASEPAQPATRHPLLFALVAKQLPARRQRVVQRYSASPSHCQL